MKTHSRNRCGLLRKLFKSLQKQVLGLLYEKKSYQPYILSIKFKLVMLLNGSQLIFGNALET